MRIVHFKNSLFHFVIKNSIFGLISTLKKKPTQIETPNSTKTSLTDDLSKL